MRVVIWLRYGPTISSTSPVSGIDRCAIDYARLLSRDFDITVVGRGEKVESIQGGAVFYGIKADSEVEYLRKSIRYLDETDFDILHCMTHKYYMLLEKRKFKVIQHFHGQDAPLFWEHLKPEFYANPQYGEGEKMFLSSRLEHLSRWARMPNEGLDAVVACSEFIKENATVDVDFPVEVIYNYADLEEVGKPDCDKEDFVLFVGSLVPAKGVFTLARAAKILEDKKRKTPVMVIGSSSIWNVDFDGMVLREFAKRRNIEYLGLKSHAEVLGCMRKASVGVIPSVFQDPSPFVAYEFQACGTPVVASRVGGIPEIIVDGETGFLVGPDNPEELAGKILCLLDNPGLRARMGDRGRKRIEKYFTSKVVKKQYIKLYRRLAGE